VEVDKPLQRGVMLKPDKTAKPEWFQIQFEKLSFFASHVEKWDTRSWSALRRPQETSREVTL
jgi:hypothetical protein